jgi:hypothetical protein
MVSLVKLFIEELWAFLEAFYKFGDRNRRYRKALVSPLAPSGVRRYLSTSTRTGDRKERKG